MPASGSFNRASKHYQDLCPPPALRGLERTTDVPQADVSECAVRFNGLSSGRMLFGHERTSQRLDSSQELQHWVQNASALASV